MTLVLDIFKIKYIALFPSYNLEIENYKDKHWFINL